jgi:serine/threonine protein kinase
MESNDDNDIWMDMKDVAIGQKIGQGQFSTVYVGKYFGDLIAVKKQVRDVQALETYLIREITVLKKCVHENLVSYIGASNELSEEEGGQHALYIFTELCPGGDLLELLVNQKQELGWKFRIKIALEAATALAYMHSNNFIHRDMKSSNLLLDSDWRCKITDFGLAREVEDHSPRRYDHV